MQELEGAQVRPLGWEGPLEEGMAAHTSVLAWRVPMDRGAWRAAAHGVPELDTAERLGTQCALKARLAYRKASSCRITF